MSTAVAKRDAITDICLTINSPEFKKGRLQPAEPESGLSVERFARVATTALQLNPDVVNKGTKGSVLTSLIRCYQDGLLPDGKEAALVLFGNQATYMPMVGGFRKIAAGYGFSLVANVVYANDEFGYELGMAPALTHRPAGLEADPGEPIGAYAVAVGPDGRKYLTVMRKAEIEQVRAVSKAKGSGPWTQWWGEMAKKTVVRRLFKELPLGADDRTSRVLATDDEGYELTGPLDDLPTVDVSEEYEPVEGEIVDDGLPEFGDAA